MVPIERVRVRVGDVTAAGRIKATLQFDREHTAPLFWYRGGVVSADHAVLQLAAANCHRFRVKQEQPIRA
jgi:hypothetical protein